MARYGRGGYRAGQQANTNVKVGDEIPGKAGPVEMSIVGDSHRTISPVTPVNNGEITKKLDEQELELRKDASLAPPVADTSIAQMQQEEGHETEKVQGQGIEIKNGGAALGAGPIEIPSFDEARNQKAGEVGQSDARVDAPAEPAPASLPSDAVPPASQVDVQPVGGATEVTF